MFCKKCGQRLPDDCAFCSKCGARMNAFSNSPISPPVSRPTPIVNANSNVVAVKKKNKLILAIVAVVLVIIIIWVTIAKVSGNSAYRVASEYLTARYDCDAKQLVSLVPDDVVSAITREYGCSQSDLIEAVEHEILYDKSKYSECDEIKSCEERDVIDKSNFDDYIDWRVEDCINVEKIKSMSKYRVNVNNNYYFDGIIVYEYGSKYYSLDATNFVAYAVWEKY